MSLVFVSMLKSLVGKPAGLYIFVETARIADVDAAKR